MAQLLPSDNKQIAIIGGGLVGSLAGCYFRRHKYETSIFESRSDIRKEQIVVGKSINMALSHRGRLALRTVGLEDVVTSRGIPMRARMIHNRDGNMNPIPYGKDDEYIISISRRLLNEILLNACEERGVNLHFNHKLVGGDVRKGEMEFETRPDAAGGDTVGASKVTASSIIGCDGAHSAVRAMIDRLTRFNYAQEYIEHGYVELHIPARFDGEFAMPPNYLHIWPREEFMLIALPNDDKTFTVTLFMPFARFEQLKSNADLIAFFTECFPDALNLIGRDELCRLYFEVSHGRPLPLISIKCRPYHLTSHCILLGDAAHAMVPFYGQGMNAAFEDMFVLDRILNEKAFNFEAAFTAYTETRRADAEAICDLAMYNYFEMRSHVNHWWFRLRKKLDNALFWLFPRRWVPLYTSVAFTSLPYSECVRNRQRQDVILRNSMIVSSAIITLGLVVFVKFKPSTKPQGISIPVWPFASGSFVINYT